MSSSLFCAGSWLLAWPVFLTRQRSRWDWMLLITFAGQLGFWLCFTHEGGRFMVPAILVLGLLVGRSIESLPSMLRTTAAVILLTLAAVSGLQLVERFEADTGPFLPAAEHGEKQSQLAAAGQLFRSDLLATNPGVLSGWLNRWLLAHGAPADRPILWMVGDATAFNVVYPARYEVAFSHSRLADQLAKHSSEEVVEWLRKQGCRHLYVNWQEVARLRSSYGFADSITRETLRPLGQVYYALETDPAGLPPAAASQPDSAKSNLLETFEPAWLIELPLPLPVPTSQSDK
jgi:hypothetical protein